MTLNTLNSIIENFIAEITIDQYYWDSYEDLVTDPTGFRMKKCEKKLVKKIIKSNFWKNKTIEDLRSMVSYMLEWGVDTDKIIDDFEDELRWSDDDCNEDLTYVFISTYFYAYFNKMGDKIINDERIQLVWGTTCYCELSFVKCILNEVINQVGGFYIPHMKDVKNITMKSSKI